MLYNSGYRWEARLHSRRRRSSLRRSLVVLEQAAPVAEFRGEPLKKAFEEMWLSNQLCVSTKCDPMRVYSVGDLVYALNHNLNHQWTAVTVTKRHVGDMYDMKIGIGT
ncbi:unnamed protein product [Hymenolepis diminuta]|uniref:Uncharacterized protein n=1 Tax=Hymenolepis diminuta TaxID=6216 RepID=A0A564Z2R4_HYMDI|nr:unnamed protein product [Hymenolepis diminuta]